MTQIHKRLVMQRCNPYLLLLVLVFPAFHQASHPVQADEPQVRVFSWHSTEVTGLAFVPNGTRLISTSLRDDRISTIVPSEGSPGSFGDSVGTVTGSRSHAVTVSPDGTRVAIAGFRFTAVYAMKTRQEQWRMKTTADDYSPPYVMALAFSPDGQWLATSGSSSEVGGPHGYKGGLISIRNAASGEEIRRFDDLSHASGSIAFSPDGKLLAAGTYGAGGELPEPGELRLYNATSGKLLHVSKTEDSVRAGKDHSAVNGIPFSPDSGQIAIANSDSVVQLWDVTTKHVHRVLNGHRSAIRRVAFHPDGRILASAGLDHTVRLWDTRTGQQLNSFSVDSPKINALSFSPDGSLLVAGGGDLIRSGEVCMWNVQDLIQK